MSVHDLRAKYGGKKREAINRAIRAELIAGNEILDAMASLSNAGHKLRTRNLPGASECDQALETLHTARQYLRDEIIHRYDLPPDQD